MIVKLGNLYYYPLKLYVFIGSYLYFRNLRVVGKQNIPAKGPLIYAINHQNALLDALLLSVVTWRSAHFLTRADVFNKKVVDKILRGLKMLPIYRIRDGYDSIKRNEAIFEAAKQILNRGGVMGIFPEGSHSLQHKVRPLKKGVARIAFLAEEEAKFKLNTKIIPIGIQYESHFSPKGRTLITFGKPINVSDYQEVYEQDKNAGIDALVSDLRMKMKSLVVNIDSLDYDQVYQEYRSKRIFKNDLVEQLKSDQELIRCIEANQPFQDTPQKGNVVVRSLVLTWTYIWKILAFIPAKLVDYVVKKNTKDPHFYGTMRFVFSIFGYPIFYLIIYIIVRSLVY